MCSFLKNKMHCTYNQHKKKYFVWISVSYHPVYSSTLSEGGASPEANKALQPEHVLTMSMLTGGGSRGDVLLLFHCPIHWVQVRRWPTNRKSIVATSSVLGVREIFFCQCRHIYAYLAGSQVYLILFTRLAEIQGSITETSYLEHSGR